MSTKFNSISTLFIVGVNMEFLSPTRKKEVEDSATAGNGQNFGISCSVMLSSLVPFMFVWKSFVSLFEDYHMHLSSNGTKKITIFLLASHIIVSDH